MYDGPSALCSKVYKSFILLQDSGGDPELMHMRSPWALSTIETLLFMGMVLALAGAGTWASTFG
jgi:hypothetical protein